MPIFWRICADFRCKKGTAHRTMAAARKRQTFLRKIAKQLWKRATFAQKRREAFARIAQRTLQQRDQKQRASTFWERQAPLPPPTNLGPRTVPSPGWFQIRRGAGDASSRGEGFFSVPRLFLSFSPIRKFFNDFQLNSEVFSSFLSSSQVVKFLKAFQFLGTS